MKRATPFLAMLPLLVAGRLGAQAPELRVDAGSERAVFAASTSHGHPALPAAALQALGADVEIDERGAVVVLFGDTLRFELRSPYFFAGREPHQLADPVYAADGTIYFPRQLFTEWIPARYEGRATRTRSGLRLAGRSLPPPGRLTMGPPLADARPAYPRVDTTRVVILDPGHGGRDPGKIGPGGIRESDVALQVGLRLADILRRRGYEVHLTRTRDVLVPLAERPRMANRWKGDRPSALFMSLHANSGGSRPGASQARGFETFFLSEARTEDERRVAEMENAAVRFENGATEAAGGDLDMILKGLLNNYYLHASHQLAQVVQDQLATFHPGPNRGVKQAPFRVLVGALMPAVLVEVAFLSNAREARLLATGAFQDQVARGLADAVDRFFDGNKHLLTAGSAP